MNAHVPDGSGGGTLATRLVLYVVAVNAAVGISVLVAGGTGRTGGKILLTSLTLTGGVMLGLACSIGRWTLGWSAAWLAGIASAAAGVGMVVVGIWAAPDAAAYWKATGSLATIAASVALVSLVGLASLADRHRWVLVVVAGLVTLLGLMLIIGMWSEIDSSWFWRVFGSVAVALAAFTLAAPVLGRADRREETSPGPAIRLVTFCPNCGSPVERGSAVSTRCGRCGAAFTVRFEGPDDRSEASALRD